MFDVSEDENSCDGDDKTADSQMRQINSKDEKESADLGENSKHI